MDWALFGTAANEISHTAKNFSIVDKT
jgi:hypothetical protein